MEIIYNIIQTTLESFDFAFCIIVNILTYLITVVVIGKKGNKRINTWIKRLILIAVILSTGVLYYLIGSDTKTLVNSAILAPVFWSWILKPICKHFNIDYKSIGVFE